MKLNKIQNVLSENLGEGYHIVRENGELSPMIEWVDWIQQSDDESDIIVEVGYSATHLETFEKGIELRQIWREDVV